MDVKGKQRRGAELRAGRHPLSQARVKRELSQATLSDLSGVAQPRISQAENFKRALGPEEVDALVVALECGREEIVASPEAWAEGVEEREAREERRREEMMRGWSARTPWAPPRHIEQIIPAAPGWYATLKDRHYHQRDGSEEVRAPVAAWALMRYGDGEDAAREIVGVCATEGRGMRPATEILGLVDYSSETLERYRREREQDDEQPEGRS